MKPTPEAELATRVLRNGGFPDLGDIARALRSGKPLPMEVRTFLADLIEGKVARPKGRPTNNDLQSLYEFVAADMMESGLRDEARELTRAERDHMDPSEYVREQIARDMNKSPDTVKDMLRPGYANRFYGDGDPSGGKTGI